MVTYQYLFEQLNIHYGLSVNDGRTTGIYEAQDFVDVDAYVERRHAARIFHMLILKQFGVRDLGSIDSASSLLDLYDCRLCVNHIAQVYLRGIMFERLEHIFDGRAELSESELEKAVGAIDLICENK